MCLPLQSLVITTVTYNGKLRIAIGLEKGFIDAHKLKSFMENAFRSIYEAACHN